MPTPPTPFQLHLKSLGACPDARQWAESRTAEQAWDECPRPEWLLWWAARDGVSKQEIVKVACQITRTVLHLAEGAIEATEKWVANPTEKNRALCRAAYAAAAAIAYTAYAAVQATAVEAAYVVADVTAAAADATTVVAALDTQPHANFCSIIRATLPQPWTEPPQPWTEPL